MPRGSILASVLIVLLARIGSRPRAADSTTIHAERVQGAIRIDGVLDEAAWAGAALIPDLTQQEPHPGAPTTFRTEVRILVDGESIYLGFTCVDPEPAKIAVHTLQRDASLDADDHVTIVLDTFLDGRTGYFFEVNAAGARTDGLISGPDSSSSD